MQELQNIALSRSQGQLMITLLKICCGGGQWFGVLFFCFCFCLFLIMQRLHFFYIVSCLYS